MRLLSENQSNRIVRRRKKQPRWLPTFQKIPNQGFKSFINVRSQPLSTIPSKDLLKSEIDESDLSNVLWVGSRFNQPFSYEEDINNWFGTNSLVVRFRAMLGGRAGSSRILGRCIQERSRIDDSLSQESVYSSSANAFQWWRRRSLWVTETIARAIVERPSMFSANLPAGCAAFFSFGNSISISKKEEEDSKESSLAVFVFYFQHEAICSVARVLWESSSSIASTMVFRVLNRERWRRRRRGKREKQRRNEHQRWSRLFGINWKK